MRGERCHRLRRRLAVRWPQHACSAAVGWRVSTWLREHGARLRLHFLPTYYPNENRIERLCLDLHAIVTRNPLSRPTAELMHAVHRHLATRFSLAEIIAA